MRLSRLSRQDLARVQYAIGLQKVLDPSHHLYPLATIVQQKPSQRSESTKFAFTKHREIGNT